MKLDWLAIDPESSFPFCCQKGYLNTYVTTRPLRPAYFDGSSAANVAFPGTMDGQEIVMRGKSSRGS